MSKATRNLLLIVIIIGAACVSIGRPIDMEAAARIEIGMTEEEVVTIMGKPTNVHEQLGSELLLWIYVSPTLNSQSFSVKLVDDRVVFINREVSR